jgi:hypothetical protein
MIRSLEQFGISHFEEGVWINYTPSQVNNISSILALPSTRNPDEIYLNSMHNGILQFIDGTAATQYGINNSFE